MRLVATLVLLAGAAFAATSAEPTSTQIDDIIARFAAKETAFAKARSNYTYRQTAKVEEVDDYGNVTGQWQMVSDIIFTPDGHRIERVAYAPVPSLHNILLTPQDEQDLRDVQPFVLTSDEVPNYYIRYLGKEQLDEIDCYAFAVKPKKMEQGKRYFEGIVWVDDQDLQIVKSYGRGIGLLKHSEDNQFPKFETYRQQIDGKNWFPTYTIANDTLNFKDSSQRIRMIVKYENYKQFRSDVQIKYDTQDAGKDQSKPPASEPPKQP
ncbi:MAG TPA: hypothetical protein VMH80_00780 [Bryobacteraceae bacterium]|nr:hypothetical protein [Bryobacteraceae bacterium]